MAGHEPHWGNALWPDENPEDYVRITAHEWREDARSLIRHAVEAYDRVTDIPEDLWTVVEDYYRAMCQAERRERDHHGD